MKALLLMLFLSGNVWSAPCTSTTVGPCTATAGQKLEIMDAIEAGQKREKEMRAAFDAAKEAITEDAKYDAISRALQAETRMKEEFSSAMQLTEQYYHLTPAHASGSVVLVKDPLGRGAWSQGRHADWKPEFLYDDKVIVTVLGADGINHFIGGPIDAK